MRSSSIFVTVTAAVWSILSPALTAAAGSAESFYDIEHVVGEDGIQNAEQALVDRLAGNGTEVGAARSALEHAGAAYVGSTKKGSLKFVYALPETYVRIVLDQENGLVSGTSVRRQTLGG